MSTLIGWAEVSTSARVCDRSRLTTKPVNTLNWTSICCWLVSRTPVLGLTRMFSPPPPREFHSAFWIAVWKFPPAAARSALNSANSPLRKVWMKSAAFMSPLPTSGRVARAPPPPHTRPRVAAARRPVPPHLRQQSTAEGLDEIRRLHEPVAHEWQVRARRHRVQPALYRSQEGVQAAQKDPGVVRQQIIEVQPVEQRAEVRRDNVYLGVRSE